MRRTLFHCIILFIFPLCALGQRLPLGAVPVQYRLTFTPDFQTRTFTGEEVITIRLIKPTNSITLNAAEIKFNAASVEVGRTSIPAKAFLDADRETAKIIASRPLPAGLVKLHISFTGELNDKLRGFYFSQSGGRKYAVTQFEPTDARRAFPCFDEPDRKATFDITIVADKTDTAISNSKIVSDAPGPGENKQTIHFAVTPKMSTYLVAMLVGQFECAEGSADGIPIRACGVPGKKQLGGFAVQAAEYFLHYYDSYFAMKYPWSKLDMIALPDFEAGAMENIGAITYREDALLIDEKHASLAAQKRVAIDIAHEMAHQWFGDLVTMKWWDNLWLNEGFATWMESKPVAEWKPEWKQPLDDVSATGRTLELDSLTTTRPIRSRADTNDEINEQFDGISYGKANAVLRMVESYVTPRVFRQGVNNYLKAHSYGNATAEDFWGAITKVSGKPVNKVMSSFVVQPGVPLISIFQHGAEAGLMQERFFSDRQLLGSARDQVWTIPVCLKQLPPAGTQVESAAPGGEQNGKCVLFTGKQQTVPLPGGSGTVVLNAGAHGYYRSDYSAESRKAIAVAAEHALTPAERISLLDDEWALARVGRESLAEYMDLLEALRADREPVVVEKVLSVIEDIRDSLVAESEQPAFRAWVRAYLRPIYADLNKPNARLGEEERELRANVFGVLGRSGEDPEIVAEARRLTEQYLQDPDSVDSNMAAEAPPLAAAHGDAALLDQFVRQLKNAKTPQQYTQVLHAIPAFSDPVLVRRVLELAVSGQVRNQDSAGLIMRVMEHPAGKNIAWDFVRSHWDQVLAQTTVSSGAAIVSGTASFCSADMAEQVRQFFSVNKVPAAERRLRQTIERINECADFKSLQQHNLASWLSSHAPSQAGQ